MPRCTEEVYCCAQPGDSSNRDIQSIAHRAQADQHVAAAMYRVQYVYCIVVSMDSNARFAGMSTEFSVLYSYCFIEVQYLVQGLWPRPNQRNKSPMFQLQGSPSLDLKDSVVSRYVSSPPWNSHQGVFWSDVDSHCLLDPVILQPPPPSTIGGLFTISIMAVTELSTSPLQRPRAATTALPATSQASTPRQPVPGLTSMFPPGSPPLGGEYGITSTAQGMSVAIVTGSTPD